MNKKLKLANEKADDLMEELDNIYISYKLSEQALEVVNAYKEIISLLMKQWKQVKN